MGCFCSDKKYCVNYAPSGVRHLVDVYREEKEATCWLGPRHTRVRIINPRAHSQRGFTVVVPCVCVCVRLSFRSFLPPRPRRSQNIGTNGFIATQKKRLYSRFLHHSVATASLVLLASNATNYT